MKALLTNRNYLVFIGTLSALASFIYITFSMIPMVYLSIVLSYLLTRPQKKLMQHGMSQTLASLLLISAIFTVIILTFLFVIPNLSHQIVKLSWTVDDWLKHGQQYIDMLPINTQPLHAYFDNQTIQTQIVPSIQKMTTMLLHFSLSSVLNIINVVTYFLIIPILSLLILCDHQKLKADWLDRVFPYKNQLFIRFFREINQQCIIYIKGKGLEACIITLVFLAVFKFCQLKYWLVLALLCGLSVFIPVLGIVAASIPTVIAALSHWGFGYPSFVIMGVFSLIMILDAYVLVPYLFSSTMQLSPAIILIAIFLFGGLFGIGGVFFALPLATAVSSFITISRDTAGLSS